MKGSSIFHEVHWCLLFVAWKLLGLALGIAETAESVQTELIDGGGCKYDIISQYKQSLLFVFGIKIR